MIVLKIRSYICSKVIVSLLANDFQSPPLHYNRKEWMATFSEDAFNDMLCFLNTKSFLQI